MIRAAGVIASFSTRLEAEALTGDVLEGCGRALVDTYACAVAGWNEPATQLALRYAQGSKSAGSSAESVASCWGSGEALPLELAALCNGVASHVLDYDDIAPPMRGHPSAAMFPALLAAAEAVDATGRQFACAYAVGFEVISKLSRAFAFEHYARGWHSSSTIGVVGAAVACAKMLSLNAVETTHAIGLAAAQACGFQANFGSHAKSLQVAHASASGLRAALLAREGFTASSDALDGARGYTSLYAPGASLNEQLSRLGEKPLEIVSSSVEVKRYPICYAAHRAIDAVLELRRSEGLKADNIRRVHVCAAPGNLSPLTQNLPQTGAEAMFSMQYAIAASIIDGHVGLQSLSDAAVQRPAIQKLMPMVTLDDSGIPTPGERWSEVHVEQFNGGRFLKRIEILRGSGGSPLSASELQDKVADCLKWGRSRTDASILVSDSLSLGHTSMRQWLARAIQTLN